ncbi:MAG: hypothetical protein FP812_20895 [Desulfobacula sp.]|nr:hypothetical protein [Desulfobacula sp.]
MFGQISALKRLDEKHHAIKRQQGSLPSPVKRALLMPSQSIPFHFYFKRSLIEKKSEWRYLSSKKLKSEIREIEKKLFESGFYAAYLHSRIYFTKVEFTYFFHLDIESPEAPGHSDISKNIQAAQEFLIFLMEENLTEGLTIFLTGNGFRFCWPYIIPLKYKKAFLAWIQKNECIDAGPQKNNSFFRLIGYRGNPRQGKGKDCHIQKLDSPDDLMGLDKEKYLQLTKGKPDYNECMEWLDGDILPDREIPPEWEQFFRGWKEFTDLQGTIYGEESLSDSALYDVREKWDQINAYLESQGILYREKISNETKTLILLKTCPICGGKKTAYITESGRLKCWHANSCRAGARHEKGVILGLPPVEWVKDFEEIEVDLPPATGNFSTKEEIRAMIEKKVVEPGDKFLGIDPGVGKTHTTIKTILPRCVLRPHGMMNVLYSGPTHDLNKEVYENALEWASPGTNVYQVKGRNPKNCRKYSEIEKVVKLGYSPVVLVCVGCRKENPGKKCKHDIQFENMKIGAGFGTAPHQKLPYMDLDQYPIDLLILDESPLSSFFTSVSLSLDDILFFAKGYQGTFFEKLLKVILANYAAADPENRTHGAQNRIYIDTPPQDSIWENSQILWEQADISEAERDQLSRHLSAYGQLELESFPRWMNRIYELGVNFKALNWVLCALGEKTGTVYIKINLKPLKERETEKNRCEFVRISMDLPKFTGQIISLDGTSTKQENDAIFKNQNRDFELIEGRISIDTCQKNLVRRGMGKVKAKELKNNPKLLKSPMVDLIKFLRPQDHKILIATHQLLEEPLFEIAKELLPDKELGIIHFYGNRGINAYSDYDAIICFGAPGPAQNARLDEAMVLFPDRAARKKWFQDQADAELVQTIHRIRPVNGGKNIILLGRRWLPQLGALNCEIDVRKGSDKFHHSTAKAYSRLKKF